MIYGTKFCMRLKSMRINTLQYKDTSDNARDLLRERAARTKI